MQILQWNISFFYLVPWAHDRKKPFRCDFCNKNMVSYILKDLRNHLAKAHNEKTILTRVIRTWKFPYKFLFTKIGVDEALKMTRLKMFFGWNFCILVVMGKILKKVVGRKANAPHLHGRIIHECPPKCQKHMSLVHEGKKTVI